VALLVLGKPKTVRADDDAIFQRHVIAENAVLPHHGMSMSEEIATGLHAGVEHHVGAAWHGRPASLRTNHHVSPNVRPRADDRRRIDDRRWMNAGRVNRRLIEDSQRAREGEIGILSRSVAASISGNSGSTSTAAALVLRARPPYLGIGHEGNLRRPGLLNPFHACYFQLRVSAQLRT